MLKIGFLNSTEEFGPNDLLDFAVLCDQNGFDTVWFSDHFHPWSHTGAHGTFSWVDIAVALERTKKVQIGSAVTCPTLRYNPAVVAQAFATLDIIYPGRVFLGLGTGEAMNEVPVGCVWPRFSERYSRLIEAIEVIKALWKRDWVTYRGKYYNLIKANLYDKPRESIPLYIAAFGNRAARLAGKYGDGLMTLPHEGVQKLFSEADTAAKEAGKDPSKIEKAALLHISYNNDPTKAIEAARFWGGLLMPIFFDLGVSDPRVVEQHGRLVNDDALKSAFVVTCSVEEVTQRIEKEIKNGFNHFGIAGSGDVRNFIREFGKKEIPYLKETYGRL